MVLFYFEDRGVVLRGDCCGILKMMVWRYEEGGVGWCGTLKRVGGILKMVAF